MSHKARNLKKRKKVEIKKTKIGEIKPYPKNAKKHNKKQIAQVAASIKEFGFNQPIVVDKDGVIIVGHGRYEAAKALRMPDVPVLEVDLTEEQAKSYRLADNKLNESDWDMGLVIDELKGLSNEMFDLTGFDKDLIIEPDEKDDVIPEVKENKSKLGDLYELGKHRVLCGDSTKREDVERLMAGAKADMVFTDPPYNVDYGSSKNPRHNIPKIMGDKQNQNDWIEFNKKLVDIFRDYNNGDIYVWGASGRDGMKQRLIFCESGIHWSATICWVKQQLVLSPANYQRMYEPCFYGWIGKSSFNGDRTQTEVWEDLKEVKTKFDGIYTTISFQGYKVKLKGKIEEGEIIRKKQKVDIWRYDRPFVSENHPTMKPVAICENGIFNSSKADDIVLDLFLGSGSTLIAAQKTNRVCYGMELSEAYCDVIVQRYVDYTGNENIIKNGEKIVWQKSADQH